MSVNQTIEISMISKTYLLSMPYSNDTATSAKAQVLAEYDAADRGERGAILRREGLYSSHIVEWRKAAEAGTASALGPKARDRRDREVEQLRARAERAEAELARTRAALDIVGKAHALLETLSESTGTPTPPQR